MILQEIIYLHFHSSQNNLFRTVPKQYFSNVFFEDVLYDLSDYNGSSCLAKRICS